MTSAPVADRSAVLRAEGLVKDYQSGPETVRILGGLSLSVAPGELVALVGASGAGKTTLLQLLGLLDQPTAGVIEVEGRRADGLSPVEAARVRRERLGFVFQFHNLLRELTALENVALPGLLCDRTRREAEQRARELLAAVGLEGRAGRRPGELSGGEQQRVAIARALANRPAAVLADEPTGSLDATSSSAVLDACVALQRASGTAFLVATHNPLVAERADRVVRLAGGQLVAARDG